jgi:hypothetical protein
VHRTRHDGPRGQRISERPARGALRFVNGVLAIASLAKRRRWRAPCSAVAAWRRLMAKPLGLEILCREERERRRTHAMALVLLVGVLAIPGGAISL